MGLIIVMIDDCQAAITFYCYVSTIAVFFYLPTLANEVIR